MRFLYERWFAGLTLRGVLLIALLCVFNALRRNSTEFIDRAFGEWLRNTFEAFGTGLIAMLLIMMTVVATYNRVPAAPRRRYPALALAILIASAAGTAILGLIEAHGSLEVLLEPLDQGGSLVAWFV